MLLYVAPQEQAVSERHGDAVRIAKGENETMGDRQRILVVDDELGPREALRMILKSRFEVMTASGGSEALVLLQQTPPDLVFLDIKMREISGIEDPRHDQANRCQYRGRDDDGLCLAGNRPRSGGPARLGLSHQTIQQSRGGTGRQQSPGASRRTHRFTARDPQTLEQMRTLTEPIETGTSFVQSATLLLEQGAQALQASCCAAVYYGYYRAGLDEHRAVACATTSTWRPGAKHPGSPCYNTPSPDEQPHCFFAATAAGHQQAVARVIRPLGYDSGVFFPLLAGTHAPRWTRVPVYDWPHHTSQLARTLVRRSPRLSP